MSARLVGIGRSTKGVDLRLVSGQIVVIGRHDECTIALNRPASPDDEGLVSRQHAILEEVAPDQWCVYDTGSLNGSAVLRAGLAPARELALGERHVLEHDDVIELAGAQGFQFVFHELDTSTIASTTASVATVTELLPATLRRPEPATPRHLSDLLVGAQTITIGTASDADCRIVDRSLSRHHAIVWRDNERLFVRDLRSLNGTTVNGARVDDVSELRRGDLLTLGHVRVTVDEACWSAAPSDAISIDLRLVDVSVDVAGKRRVHGVSFAVRQGAIVGLLGPSASGKSTLLKALAGRLPLAGGAVYINGHQVGARDGRWGWLSSLMGYRNDDDHVGFLQQQDLVQPGLTVQEILEYAARHMGADAATARARAADAAMRCNLESLLDRVVRSHDGQLHLSGGQLKRTCVALEVLRQPRVLLLDEPTTGQDPKNTRDQLSLFRSLCDDGVTMVISTHDLQSLEWFDAIAVLCLGRLVFWGPPTVFPSHFGAATAEAVYRTLPDHEQHITEAEALAQAFQRSALFTSTQADV